jgi:hypothetical protein
MATVHTCDVCKKPIDGARVVVDVSGAFDRFELCKKHGAPILAALKKYKLAS